MLHLDDINVGQSYTQDRVRDRVVTITRIWSKEELGVGVAYEIKDGAHLKNPRTAHSALPLSLFSELHSLLPDAGV